MKRNFPLTLMTITLAAGLALPAVAQDTYTVPYLVDGERYEATLERGDDGTLTIVDYGNDELTASQQASIDEHVETFNSRSSTRTAALEDGTLDEDEVDAALAEAEASSEDIRTSIESSRADVESAQETGERETVEAALSDARDNLRSTLEDR